MHLVGSSSHIESVMVSGPGRWVGIARQDCSYEPEPTIAASMTLTLLTYQLGDVYIRNRLGVNVRIARCRWFDSVIFTLCTSVRVPDDALWTISLNMPAV